MPGTEPGPRYLFQRTTHDTADVAAILASAARAWAPYDAAAAAAWLNAAEAAWAFLTRTPEAPVGGFKNPGGPAECPGATGEYNDEFDADNRLWAAAELYRATGQAQYHDYVRAWYADPVYTNGNSGAGLGHYPQAFWAYLMAAHNTSVWVILFLFVSVSFLILHTFTCRCQRFGVSVPSTLWRAGNHYLRFRLAAPVNCPLCILLHRPFFH